MNKFSIYVHVPWCKRRCPYCNFYLVVGRPDGAFVDGLIAEWQARRAQFSGQAVTLYFGGGTPSLLAPSEIARLIDHFRDSGVLAHDAEITLEANPEDLSAAYVDELVKTPINRISLGVQSFDDQILKTLGRKHTGEMARTSIALLMDRGLTNISVDQIIGVPDENPDQIISAITYLADAGVKHVSTYLLTIEEGTRFHRHNVSPSDDAQADIYTRVQSELTRLGYDQYDISSFAKTGFLSRHNQAYWASQDYVGLGPGAHSMRMLDGAGSGAGIERAHNEAGIEAWLKDPTAESGRSVEVLPADAAFSEALAFGLRNMMYGLNPLERASLYGAALPPGFMQIMDQFIETGWLARRDGSYVITAKGALFADAIMREILLA